MMEERIIELETRYAYQDETLRVLSDTVAAQQQQIDSLKALCLQLADRVRNASADTFKSTPADEVPPHY
ncbi:SlyX family protein [Panacagrimonas sp.]|uniref:SlyX family protein n=1 Tax=Panacagrimonas sp. TaxID=2480088 RepID=UPI003B517E01